jgi:hypothetical protein
MKRTIRKLFTGAEVADLLARQTLQAHAVEGPLDVEVAMMSVNVAGPRGPTLSQVRVELTYEAAEN